MLETVKSTRAPKPPVSRSTVLCLRQGDQADWNGDAFKFSDTYRCCQSVNLQPADGGGTWLRRPRQWSN